MDLYRLPRRAHVLQQLTLALSPSGVSSTSMHAASAAATAANAASMSISMRASLLALCLHGRDQDPSDQASSCSADDPDESHDFRPSLPFRLITLIITRRGRTGLYI